MASITTTAILAAAMTFVTPALALTLSSPDLTDNGTIPSRNVFNRFGCNGANTSPALRWSGAPDGTMGFAVTVFDPGGHVGTGFWHWVIFDIPPSATALATNAGDPRAGLAPPGSVQARNDFGLPGYGGPCPPPGPAHHYAFTVYALNATAIKLGPTAKPGVIAALLRQHAIATATLTAVYRR